MYSSSVLVILLIYILLGNEFQLSYICQISSFNKIRHSELLMNEHQLTNDSIDKERKDIL